MNGMENATPRSSSDINTELAARRTGMSFQRTRMSADRTLMSIIRTSLSLISFGFTIFQLVQKLKDNNVLAGATGASRHFGLALVVLGIAMLDHRHHLSSTVHVRSSHDASANEGRGPHSW